jgi:hypothetical protein
MKKFKGFLIAVAVLTIVSSALAFRPYASGTVYCTNACAAGHQVAFKIDPSGTNTAPCGLGVQPYVFCGDGSCTATSPGVKFKTTTDQ